MVICSSNFGAGVMEVVVEEDGVVREGSGFRTEATWRRAMEKTLRRGEVAWRERWLAEMAGTVPAGVDGSP